MVPQKYKWFFLLAVSLLFYFIIHPLCPLILLFVSYEGYNHAFMIQNSITERGKIRNLIWGVMFNVLILFSFKYLADFFNLLNHALGMGIVCDRSALFPLVGVSYFVFQNISYLIDIYLEKLEPENSFIAYALYMSFFPKLVQGPIERASNLISQFKKNHIFDLEVVRDGVRLFFGGMFKKIVIADRLAPVVSRVFDSDLTSNTSGAFIIAIYIYAIQIYADFSGYTDMALGSARIFGIKLTDNFNLPYFARSVQDFWKRWHISLSSWILDYIFKPLQMKWRDYGDAGLIASLFLTFFICGVWHGLTANYILWGVYHGLLISISFLMNKKWLKFCKKKSFNEKIVNSFDIFVTFNLVSFSWLIFRTSNLDDLYMVIKKIYFDTINFSLSFRGTNIGFTGELKVIVLLFIIIEFIRNMTDIKKYIDDCHISFRWIVYYVVLFAILNYASGETDFIYMQF